ncbi:MAG: alpha-glucan family phosphorylase, partial [Phycisphaerales bacterium]|nr:alpha-glucan family phosphorylase [Phycisphaerales bacterium]
ADVYHMNEAHALPLVFQLYQQYGDVEKVREQVAFTTHTPVSAGNEVRDLYLLQKMGFFGDVPLDVVCKITGTDSEQFGYTPAALALSRRANGVSRLHSEVARTMWDRLKVKPEIIGITNAQHQGFWQDPPLKKALDENESGTFRARKYRLKEELFRIVADQTGKIMNPEVLTIVWARRFAGYKRADLIMRDLTAFYDLLDSEQPIQIIWGGKPYPEDDFAVDLFNRLIELTRFCPRAAVVIGYELDLSASLKRGADVWLNTPRRPKEASGTSGMTAAMNGAVNFSTNDGWIPEFARHGHNAFVIPEADTGQPEEAQDDHDHEHLMRILSDEIVQCYYDDADRWDEIAANSMREVVPQFDSHRMAAEYYERLYA